MDFSNIYKEVKENLEMFIKESFGIDVVIAPKKVELVDFLEEGAGLYDSMEDAVYVTKGDEYHVKSVLAHELLHHVGHHSRDFSLSILEDDEYATELLTAAFEDFLNIKNEDVIPIYLEDNEYSRARRDAGNKSWRKILEIYRNKLDAIPIYL